MDQTTPYSTPMIDTAREHITALFQAFESATGLSRSYVAKLARGEPKFGSTFQELDFRVGSYDTVVGRMSAIWPENLPWPSNVPRQAPAEIPEDLLADFHRRVAERAAAHADPA